MKLLRVIFVLAAFVLVSCQKSVYEPFKGEYDQVFIYCGLGFNNLSGALRADVQDMVDNYPPGKYRDIAVVAYCHNTSGPYSVPCSPVLVQLHYDDGEAQLDTLKVYPKETISASKEAIAEMMLDVKQMFPSRHYGMLLSSHGTGWIPSAYPQYGEKLGDDLVLFGSKPQWVGIQTGANNSSKSIEIKDLAKAIPYHLDYLIFDACLMGAIEAIWELKDCCDYIVASPTEILTEGMVYERLVLNLLRSSNPDLLGFCNDYFEYYNQQKNFSVSGATIGLYDCRKIEAVAEVFAEILDKHRDNISQLYYSPDHQKIKFGVQRYFRLVGSQYLYPFFYDLRDFAKAIEASSMELDALDDALDEFVVYHAETERFIAVEMNNCCGISTYIPVEGYTILNSFYRNLGWNQRVGLIE